MAQPIQSMLSDEQMRQSMVARNQEPMTRELSPAGPQAMFDPLSSPAVNRQPQAEMQYAGQQIRQNMETKGIGDTAAMMGQVRKAEAEESDAAAKAQMFVNTRLSEAMLANESGGKLMQLNGVLNSPERASFLNDIALGKAQTVGVNPEMGAEAANIMNTRMA
mgnify:CR=1 FL=1